VGVAAIAAWKCMIVFKRSGKKRIELDTYMLLPFSRGQEEFLYSDFFPKTIKRRRRRKRRRRIFVAPIPDATLTQLVKILASHWFFLRKAPTRRCGRHLLRAPSMPII
jgi:hypothetical protein